MQREQRLPGRGELTGPECIFVDADPEKWAEVVDLPESIHLSLRITAAQSTAHVAIAGVGGDSEGDGREGCVLSFLLRRGRVQWGAAHGDELPPVVPSLSEIIAADHDHRGIWEPELSRHIHTRGGDFVITNVEGLESSFDLEMVFVYDAKSRSTIIDACIGGNRTLITRRKGLVLEKLRFMADGPASFERVSLRRL